MELSQDDCVVLGRDSFDNIVVRYNLIEYPSSQWTAVFNRVISIFTIKSLVNSKMIIVTANPNNLISFDTASVIKQKIEKTNNELSSDVLKNEIILNNFISGIIVIHSDMRYTDQDISENNLEGKSEYELYLNKIIERMQEHDEYEILLNVNLENI